MTCAFWRQNIQEYFTGSAPPTLYSWSASLIGSAYLFLYINFCLIFNKTFKNLTSLRQHHLQYTTFFPFSMTVELSKLELLRFSLTTIVEDFNTFVKDWNLPKLRHSKVGCNLTREYLTRMNMIARAKHASLFCFSGQVSWSFCPWKTFPARGQCYEIFLICKITIFF